MKIVINALAYKPNSSGIGVLIRELFGKMGKTATYPCLVVLSKDSPDFLNETAEEYRTPYKKEENFKRLFFQSMILGKKFCKDSVLLTTDSKIPLILPKSCKVIPVITDLALFRLPHTYQLSRVVFWKIQYWILVRRAWHYIAISESTKRDMIELLHIAGDKIEVIPCASNESIGRIEDLSQLSRVQSKYKLPEKYILFVGNFNPRKNLERLILAFDALQQNPDMADYHLVIAGEHGWKFNQNTACADVSCQEKIHFIGYVADDDMSALYSMATLFVFPTLYEGFGIPILEAQQCGTAVLAGDNSSMPEVGGHGALYTDVLDVTAIQTSMNQILEDEELRRKLIQRGYENALQFSWESSAVKLNSMIERLCES